MKLFGAAKVEQMKLFGAAKVYSNLKQEKFKQIMHSS
jgi:hypothetical protein